MIFITAIKESETGKLIKEKRKEARLTQEELSEILGISKNTLGIYERGCRVVPRHVREKIEQIFNITLPEEKGKYDLKGNHYGKLTVISYYGSIHGHRYWKCLCECGKEIVARGSHLYSGNIKSCGCLISEKNKERSSQNGLSKSRLYNIYCGMIKRCYRKKTASYENYGGRGIYVCQEWRESFLSFYNWAIQSGYKLGKSIDRIDVNGNYSPQNCRWANPIEQANNRRNTVLIMCNGVTHSAKEWERITGISSTTIKNRIKRGIPPEIALSKDIKKGGDKHART